MHRFIRSTSVAALAAVVISAGTMAANPTAAGAADPSQPVSAPSRVAASSGDARAYWTPARMRAAKPMKVERSRAKPKATVSNETGNRPKEALGSDTINAPRTTAANEVQPAFAYPFPYNRYGVEKQIRQIAPYRQVGRIFFRMNGVKFSCSGASVTGGWRNTVYTAGHCLNDGAGTWATDVIFIPGRREGSSKNPYGTFAAKELWVPSGWTDNGWWAYDLGAFSVGKNKKGKTLRKAVGALGFAYDQSRIQQFDILGYPARPPFKGNKLMRCSAAHARDDTNANGPDSMGAGCDMTGGSSGGPWIVALRRKNLINGVVSYGYDNEPAGIYSPYFDDTANKLRCAAATSNPDKTSC